MKKISLLLTLLIFSCQLSFGQSSWNTINGVNYTVDTTIAAPMNWSGSTENLSVRFESNGGQIFLVDSFSGDCSSNLIYESSTLSSDSIVIRKNDSGELNSPCCPIPYQSPLNYWIYQVYVPIINPNNASILYVQYEGSWYTIQNVSSTSLDYFPKYKIPASAQVDYNSYTLEPCDFKDLFSIENGYLWLNYGWRASDGSRYSYKVSDLDDGKVYVKILPDLCSGQVTLGWVTSCDRLRIAPCSELPNVNIQFDAQIQFFQNMYNSHGVGLKSYGFGSDPNLDYCENTDYISYYFQWVLPVEHLNLAVSPFGDYHLVNWSTASEQNTSHFELLRSQDNQKFEIAHSQSAQGTSYEKSEYTTTIPIRWDKTYYKIRAYDIDGKFTESNTVQVKNGSLEEISISPNPADDFLEIYFPSNETFYKIALIDLTGKNVFNAEINTGLENQLRIVRPDFPAGLYLLQLKNVDEGTMETYKVIFN